MSKQIPVTVDGVSYANYFLNRKGNKPTEQFIMGALGYKGFDSGFRGIRTSEYKLAYQKEGNKVVPYLFNLKNDPFEMNNIYTKDNPIVKKMYPRLQYWLKKTNDGFIVSSM
jgi:arylsulfatase A-like enzyme